MYCILYILFHTLYAISISASRIHLPSLLWSRRSWLVLLFASMDSLLSRVPPCACSVAAVNQGVLVGLLPSLLVYVSFYVGILIRWLVLVFLGHFLFCFFVVVASNCRGSQSGMSSIIAQLKVFFLLVLATGISASRILLCCCGDVCCFVCSCPRCLESLPVFAVLLVGSRGFLQSRECSLFFVFAVQTPFTLAVSLVGLDSSFRQESTSCQFSKFSG